MLTNELHLSVPLCVCLKIHCIKVCLHHCANLILVYMIIFLCSFLRCVFLEERMIDGAMLAEGERKG